MEQFVGTDHLKKQQQIANTRHCLFQTKCSRMKALLENLLYFNTEARVTPKTKRETICLAPGTAVVVTDRQNE